MPSRSWPLLPSTIHGWLSAFAAIPREDFLGPGPWLMWRWTRYVPTPDADPVYLYTNDLVALVAERYLNNGQPSLHAYLMHQAAPAAGEHVVHVGTGTGYYTAILAHLVGPSGRVTGIEYDPELAAKARPASRPTPTSRSSKVTARRHRSMPPTSSTSTPAARGQQHDGSTTSPMAAG